MSAIAGLELPPTSILQSSVDDLRNLVACRICIRPMYEPYTIQCGHTFCYSCLRQWFDRDHGKMTCPDCRAHVKHQPAPAYLVGLHRNMPQSAATVLNEVLGPRDCPNLCQHSCSFTPWRNNGGSQEYPTRRSRDHRTRQNRSRTLWWTLQRPLQASRSSSRANSGWTRWSG